MSKKSLFPTHNKSGVLVLVIALVVVGIGAQASGLLNSPTGGYLVCVNPKSSVVTHPSSAKCPPGHKRIILGTQGVAGLTGATGMSGKDGRDGEDGKTLWNGLKDPESTWGAPGDMFINSITKTLFGPKNLDGSWPASVSMVGPAGPQGPQGPSGSGPVGAVGAVGPAGEDGLSGLAITQLLICGASGTLLCKVGVQGPGDGTIFFVDYNDIYVGFNYLEAAPMSCEAQRRWSFTDANVLAARGWAARAVGAGQSNTTAIKEVFTTDSVTNNAAYFASSCRAGSKDDWFLGSLGEMMLMSDNLQGLGGFVGAYYWSSTELGPTTVWFQNITAGYAQSNTKSYSAFVRPVRAF